MLKLRFRAIAICGLSVIVTFGTLCAGEAPAPAPAPVKVEKETPPAPKPLTELPPELKTAVPEYLLDLAQVHLRYGAFDRAEPLLRAVAEKGKDTQKMSAHEALSTLLQNKGDAKGAMAELEAAAASAATPVDKGRISLTLGQHYIQDKDWDNAEKVLMNVVNTDAGPANGRWLQQNAISMLPQVWKNKPGHAEEFIKQAEAAYEKNPNDPAVIERLADLNSNVKRDYVKAAELTEKLLPLRPDDRGLQFKLGAYYQQCRQFDKAIELAKKMMTGPNVSKEDAHTQMYQIGNLLLQAGKKDESIAWIKDTFAKEAANGRDYWMMGMFYEQVGLHAESEAALTKVDEVAKTASEKADAKILLAEFALRHRELAKAEQAAKSALEQFKDNANVVSRANVVLQQVTMQKNAEAAKPNPAVLGPKPPPAPAPAAEPKAARQSPESEVPLEKIKAGEDEKK